MTRPLTLVLRPKAEADLDGIWSYTVDRWSADQARTYLEGLSDCLALLCAHPDIARLRNEFTPPVRLHPYRKHLLIYRIDGGYLDVIRIVHARSNWADILVDQDPHSENPR